MISNLMLHHVLKELLAKDSLFLAHILGGLGSLCQVLVQLDIALNVLDESCHCTVDDNGPPYILCVVDIHVILSIVI
ncbi:hypothetical protein MT325_m297L [Paramecium bursaria chlorella virus MT325]|uniref:Uncharacterized protein m297L n=1 Tax=Paramecium bursaria Chlorella virus MT325 TaxID=346932 RepID=A7IU27_PBCVM|nr:hypothetical protein MT325_m297L [Paramecium bursaria chlorella virus MT325]